MSHNTVEKIIDAVYYRAGETEETAFTRTEVLEDYIWGFINKVSELRTTWKYEESGASTTNSLASGKETFTLPTDMKYPDQRSVQVISIEGYTPLEYIPITEWRTKIVGLARTTLSGAVLAGAATIDLLDATNFPDSGDGYIAGDAFSWTGKTGNQLTGVTGVLAHDSGTVVYEVNSTGTPEKYTIQNGVGILYPAPSSTYSGLPLAIDYYKETTRPTLESDELPIPLIEPCKDYCSMRVAQKRENWSAADRFEKAATSGIIQAIRNERTGERRYISTRE